MPEYKSILGILSVLLAFVAYGVYFKQIFSGKIKPHAFSWFVWALTTAIIFFGQLVKGAGAGAWATGAISLACLIVFILALFRGHRGIVFWDWVFLISALVGLMLWWFTKDPTLSLILISFTDAAAVSPTIRKTYNKPFEESFTLFSLNAVRSIISVFAFQSYTFATVLYPAKGVLFNALIALVILVRRRQLPQ